MAQKEKRASLWSKWFKKSEKGVSHKYNDILSGVAPIYSNGFGNNIYASDVVQQAIYSIVTELKKLDPVHIRKIGSDFIEVEGDVQSILDAPNPLMTTSDFIEKISWQLLLNYNAFVYPMREGGKLVGLYPLNPSQVSFDPNYGNTGETWVRLTFPNGMIADLPYENLIHLRHHFSMSDFMGGDASGNPDFRPLIDTLEMNDTLLKGLAKSLNLQTTINGVVKTHTMKNSDEQKKMIADFEAKLQANESGLLPLDISAEYIPIQKQINLLDATTLEFIDKKILRTFGVSIPIVNGDFTKEQYEAFYQKTLEPIVKSFGQAFTKGIFTKHAAQGFNNKVVFYVKELIFMNTDQKLNLFKDLSAQGGVYVNEYRTAFGMRPINDLQGVRMMSLNWVNSEYAQEYQLGKNGSQSENNGSQNNEENTGGGDGE